jgi:hypothetical protein
LHKQLIIDRQAQEILSLKQKLNLNEKRLKQGFFGSSTPGSQLLVKANSLAENQAKRGGAQPGHQATRRQVFTAQQADEVRLAEVETESYPFCQCQLVPRSANHRAIYDFQRQAVSKLFYQIERQRCPQCRKVVIARKMSYGS